MAKSRKFLTAGAIGVAALAFVAASSSVTGAYFSESKGGTIDGTLGQVHLDVNPASIAFTNMLPGEPQTATVTFQNTGTGPQDFYLVFPNVPALHALNNLGTYGEVHLTGGPTGNKIALFDSINLNDGRTLESGNSCGTFTPAGCWPLNDSYKLASSVARNGTGSFSFTFNYAGKLSNVANVNGPLAAFNGYPAQNFGGQAFGPDAAGTSASGLPYQIVATQVGQTP